MREIVLGVTLGAVTALLILAAAWLERVTPPGRWGKRLKGAGAGLRSLPEGETKRPAEGAGSFEEDRKELERLTKQAGMQNFYLYDGSPQRDPREMARDSLSRTQDHYERKAK